MSRSLDLSRFPDLPPEVVKAFAAQAAALEAAQFEARVERAARQHEHAVAAEKEAFIAELKDLIAKLEGQVQDYRRTKFGPKLFSDIEHEGSATSQMTSWGKRRSGVARP